MNQLPHILKKARQALDLTQEDVAKKLGITQRAYAFYEDEQLNKIPKPKRLAELGKILNVPINTLLKVYEPVEGKTSENGESADHLDTPLPPGNIVRTLADYISMIERFNKTMSDAIAAGLISLKLGQEQMKEQIAVLGDDLNNQLEGISVGLAAASKTDKGASGEAPKNAKGNKGH